jgi:hypothetical protein
MKRIAIYLLLLTISLSCKKEKKGCTDAGAINYVAEATSDDGTCTYERDVYIGVYDAIKTCGIYSSDSAMVFQISRSPEAANRILLEEFPETGGILYANVDLSDVNKIIIPNQTLENALDISQVSGTGTLSGSALSLSIYRIDQSNSLDTCTIEAIRR